MFYNLYFIFILKPIYTGLVLSRYVGENNTSELPHDVTFKKWLLPITYGKKALEY